MDSDFGDQFFTLCTTDLIQDKETVKVVHIASSVCLPRCTDIDTIEGVSLSPLPDEASSSISHGSSADTVLSSPDRSAERSVPWPLEFPIPRFSYNTELVLERASESYLKDGSLLNTPSIKADILGKLAETIYRYVAFPSSTQICAVAEALVKKHPCLKEPGLVSGFYGWQTSLKYKMGNYGTKLRNLGYPGLTVNVDSAVPPAPSVPALPTCAGPGRPRGAGRPKGPGRPGRPKLSGRPARRAKPGRPPKYLGGVTTEQQIQRRRARLKEVRDSVCLGQPSAVRCPLGTSVGDRCGRLTDACLPHFADVYREFEQLHGQVKKMAQDHFGSAHGVGPNAALEIRDLQVSRSLGIEELVKRSRAVQGVCKENHLPAGKRPLTDSEVNHSQPPAKSLRLEDSSGATNGIYISQNGLQGVSGEEPSTAGSDRPGHEQLRPEAAVAEAAALGDKLLQTGGGFAALEPGGDPSGVLLYQPLEVEELQEVTEAGGAGPVMFTSLDAGFSPEELVQGQLSGGGCETTVVTPAGGGEEAQLGPDGEEEAGADGETEGGALLEEISQGERGGAEPSEVLNDSDIADQMQQLENALSRDVVPLDHSYRTHVAGPGEAPQHEGVFVAGGTETEEDSHAAQSELQVMELTDLAQDGGVETNGSLQHHIAVGGTVEFQLSEANQELLSQGHEQIFIQTAEGLIMHHGAGGLASDRIVIVTDADGTTMHIRAPEGVPLETVEALLGIDTEGQSGGILVSETGP
ncbi:ZN839 protein, partial [Amia calva]|nr:ZN839 protein [Amia calva]